MDPKQLRAIELIVQGEDMEAVAAQVGVTSRTIRNWKREKTFAEEVRAQLTDLHEAFEARFNPALQRIQKLTDKFLDRLEKMLDSSDERIQLRGMQLHLQCLKWAGGKDNAGRGSGMCIDGILGPRVTYADILAKQRALAALDEEDMGRGRPAPATQNSEPIYGEPESGKKRKEPCRAGFPAGESPDVEGELPNPPRSGEAGQFSASPETGKIRKPCERAAPAPLPVNGEGLGVGSGEAGPSHPTPEAEKSGNAPSDPPANGSDSPAGSQRDMTGAEKTGNAKIHKPWRGKGANHVPFYKKFQRR